MLYGERPSPGGLCIRCPWLFPNSGSRPLAAASGLRYALLSELPLLHDHSPRPEVNGESPARLFRRKELLTEAVKAPVLSDCPEWILAGDWLIELSNLLAPELDESMPGLVDWADSVAATPPARSVLLFDPEVSGRSAPAKDSFSVSTDPSRRRRG